jgi:hypothetical protein
LTLPRSQFAGEGGEVEVEGEVKGEREGMTDPPPLQVQSTFSSSSWRDHHETWKEHRYTWLPSWQDIPKHLHEALGGGHLSNLKVRAPRRKMEKHANRLIRGRPALVVVYFLALGSWKIVSAAEPSELEYGRGPRADPGHHNAQQSQQASFIRKI